MDGCPRSGQCSSYHVKCLSICPQGYNLDQPARSECDVKKELVASQSLYIRFTSCVTVCIVSSPTTVFVEHFPIAIAAYKVVYMEQLKYIQQ